MAHLRFQTGPSAGREFPLAEGTTRIGRARDNDLVLDDPTVSRQHCLLLKHGPEVIVRLAESASATWVGHQRVNGQRAVMHGQVIRLGKVEIKLVLEADDCLDDSSTSATVTHDLLREHAPAAPREFARNLFPEAPLLGLDSPATTQISPSAPGRLEETPPPSTSIPHVPSHRTSRRRNPLLIAVTVVLTVVVFGMLFWWLFDG